ncbi:MAG: hypothetical protein KF718_10460 [Polyangiaceae bacterium]|nr:hypothetical protein [Polyangiaceae bacterium]
MRKSQAVQAVLAGLAFVTWPALAQEQAAGPEPAQGEAAAKQAPTSTGGYSWSNKPTGKRRAPRHKVDPNAAIATFPGFMMLPDGSSQVWVYLSKKVTVSVSQAPGRVTYLLAGADVAVRNNTNALVTEYFDTPLSRARLVRDKAGAQLVLELREGGAPQHVVEDGPGGTVRLRIRLPKAARSYAWDEARPRPTRR